MSQQEIKNRLEEYLTKTLQDLRSGDILAYEISTFGGTAASSHTSITFLTRDAQSLRDEVETLRDQLDVVRKAVAP